MAATIYRYRFGDGVPFQDVEESLLLGVLAAEGLYGAARVGMDACYCYAKERRACVIDATSDVGLAIARIFTSFLLHQFGPDAFRVEVVEPAPGCQAAGACA